MKNLFSAPRNAVLAASMSAVVFFSGVLSLQAQRRIEIQNHNGTIQADLREILAGPGLIGTSVKVKNVGDIKTYIGVKEVEKANIANYSVSICWGEQCLVTKPDITIVADPISLEPAAVDNSFKYELKPWDNAGNVSNARATFRFYTTDELGNANGIDSTDITYNISITGSTAIIRTAVGQQAAPTLSKPYPNPAITHTQVDIDLPNLTAQTSANLQVFDMLGQAVASYKLQSGQNAIVIPTRHLNPGIYFCSLEVNGKRYSSQRFSVTKWIPTDRRIL